MLSDTDEIKLIDFGLSKQQDQKGKKLLKTVCGTPYYIAPEVLNSKKYDTQCDNWSMGVLLYVLMSGYLPFQGRRAEVFQKITNGRWHMNHAEFKTVSSECKDLISKLLVNDPKDRLTAKAALKHPWFENKTFSVESPGIKLDPQVLGRLCNFKGSTKFQKAAMIMLIKIEDQKEIDDLHIQFDKMDSQGTGLINKLQLKKAVSDTKLGIPAENLDKIIDQVDYFNNHEISYTEFLMATVDMKHFLNEQMLSEVFN